MLIDDDDDDDETVNGYIRSTCEALSRPWSRLTSALSAWMLCTRLSATSLLLTSTIITCELRGDDGPDTG